MTSDAPQPRLPITALIAASLFFNGTGYAATLPYTGIVAIDGLGFSNADYALVLSAGSVAGVLPRLRWATCRTASATGACWCCSPR